MANQVTNLFVHRSAAQRYAAARPYFHPLVIGKIAGFTGVSRFDRALDVACGTGQSAKALIALANRVDAVDVSAEMLAECEPHPHIHFQAAPAERLPFVDSTFDLLTVGLAFHWFDQSAFLDEARRLLKPGGWLVIYTSGFNGEMLENSAFRQWAWEAYPARFPTPPRRSTGVSDELVNPHNFTIAGCDGFAHDELMTADQLTAYLLTQTNVIACVDNGKLLLSEAAAWISSEISAYFGGQSRTMRFGGSIWYLKRSSTD